MTPEAMRADAVDPGWKWLYRVAGDLGSHVKGFCERESSFPRIAEPDAHH